VQIGYGQRKVKHSNNPLNGHFKKAGVQPKKILMEFGVVPGFEYKQGPASITVTGIMDPDSL